MHDPTSSPLRLLLPGPPLLPDPEPPVVQFVYSNFQLKENRLRHQSGFHRAHYDVVQRMIEDGIAARRLREYIAWLDWVARNL